MHICKKYILSQVKTFRHFEASHFINLHLCDDHQVFQQFQSDHTIIRLISKTKLQAYYYHFFRFFFGGADDSFFSAEASKISMRRSG